MEPTTTNRPLWLPAIATGTGRPPPRAGSPPTRHAAVLLAAAWAAALLLAAHPARAQQAVAEAPGPSAPDAPAAPADTSQQDRPPRPARQYTLSIDPHFTADAGSEGLLTLHRGATALLDRYLPVRWSAEEGVWSKSLGIGYRIGQALLIGSPLASATSTAQHELFGHGAPARASSSLEATEYRVRIPSPYGEGGGYMAYRFREPASFHEVAAVAAGGLNAEAVMAGDLRERTFMRGRLHHQEAVLYGSVAQSVGGYLNASENDNRLNDIDAYVELMEDLARTTGGTAITRDDIEDRSVVELLDPYLWASLYTSLWRYVVRGEARGAVPAVEVRGVRYLPSVSLALAPYGTEYVVDNMIATPSRFVSVYGRYGSGPAGPSWGAGAAVKNAAAWGDLRLDARLDLWRQPDLVFGAARPRASLRLGASVRARAHYEVPAGRFPLHLAGTLGYKTEGFVRGQSLEEGPYVSLGIGATVR